MINILECKCLMNNFNMKARLSPQKQRQKADLVFNYMKQLKPFEQKDASRMHEAELALKQFDDSLRQKRQPVMGLSSRVYQLKLGSKKKVTFLDEKAVKDGHQDVTYRPLLGQYQNPEQIKNGLLELQKSIYSSFKIISPSTSTNHLRNTDIFSNIPFAQSLILPSQSKLRSDSNIIQQKRVSMASAQTKPYKAMRSKSQLLLTSRKKQTPSNQLKGNSIETKTSKNRTSMGNPNQIQLQSSARREYMSTPSRSKSASRVNIGKDGIQATKYWSINRSDTFWKQQNNLMIEIFKNKLSLKKSS